jgi:hypothetical protein
MAFSSLMTLVAAVLAVVTVFLCMRAVAGRRPQPLRPMAWLIAAASAIVLVAQGPATTGPQFAALLLVLFGALLTLVLARRRSAGR